MELSTTSWLARRLGSEHRLRDLGHLDGEGSGTHLSQSGRHAREAIRAGRGYLGAGPHDLG